MKKIELFLETSARSSRRLDFERRVDSRDCMTERLERAFPVVLCLHFRKWLVATPDIRQCTNYVIFQLALGGDLLLLIAVGSSHCLNNPSESSSRLSQ